MPKKTSENGPFCLKCHPNAEELIAWLYVVATREIEPVDGWKNYEVIRCPVCGSAMVKHYAD